MSGQAYYKNWEVFWRAYNSGAETPVLEDEFPGELIHPSLPILEIGFGSGRVLEYFFKRGYRIFGIDIAGSALNVLRAGRGRACPGLLSRVCLNDCSILSFRDESFQTVICLGILEHYENSAQMSTLLKEIKRVLKGGGIAVISVPHRYSAFIVIEAIKRIMGTWHSGLENKFTPAQFIRIVEAEGLRCLRYYCRSMDITPARGAARFPAYMLKFIDRLLVALKLGGHMATYLFEKDEE